MLSSKTILEMQFCVFFDFKQDFKMTLMKKFPNNKVFTLGNRIGNEFLKIKASDFSCDGENEENKFVYSFSRQ